MVELLAPEKNDTLVCNVNILLKRFKELHDLSEKPLSLSQFASITEGAQSEELRCVGREIWLVACNF